MAMASRTRTPQLHVSIYPWCAVSKKYATKMQMEGERGGGKCSRSRWRAGAEHYGTLSPGRAARKMQEEEEEEEQGHAEEEEGEEEENKVGR